MKNVLSQSSDRLLIYSHVRVEIIAQTSCYLFSQCSFICIFFLSAAYKNSCLHSKGQYGGPVALYFRQ